MKEKIKRSAFVIILLVVCIFEFSLYSEANNLSNKLLAWGFRRGENGQQPVLDIESRKVVEEAGGMCIGNPNEKNIYLTFDNGYEAGYTSQILDVLKENDVKATFFITAHYLNTANDLVKRMIEEGHIVGNHTVNHKFLPNITDEQIKDEVMKLHNSIYDQFEYEMKFFRPPKGEFSQRVLNVTNSLGYTTVMWSSAYDDWDKEKQNREEYGKKRILQNLHNGCVLLLHGTSKDNANILNDVIKEIKSMGYEFKNIDEFSK